MLPGPVFNVELLTTARRPRYYAVRVLYGLALLVLIWQNYATWERVSGTYHNPQTMRAFAESTFLSMGVMQIVLILGMTPSLTAGVIANEKQRKTLHYLLASPLTSGEIVLGKLLARMLHVAIFLAIGLPVMSLLTLIGGVDPLLVVVTTVLSLSLAFFLSSLAVLCSTVSKRVKEAISVAYAQEGFWLIFPFLVSNSLQTYHPEIYAAIKPFLDWWSATTPWGLLGVLRASSGGRLFTPLIEAVLWMVGLQVALACLFLALAVVRLRPVFKAQEGARAFRFLGIPLPGSKTGRLRLWGKKPVGDAAMWWKELHTSRTSGAAQIVAMITGVLIVGSLGYWTWIYAVPAFSDFRVSSYYATSTARVELNTFLRALTTCIGLICVLAVAVGGANTLTSEREDDTWISLVATPMDGREIVIPKMIGVVWKVRFALTGVLLLDLIGMGCGSIHPAGVLFQSLELTAFLLFGTALGTFCSLKAKSTWRSQATTTGILLTVSGGYLMCCCPVMFSGRPNFLFLAGCMPMLLGFAPVAPWDYLGLLYGGPTSPGPARDEVTQIILAGVLGTIGYAVAGSALAFASVSGFDRAADRPRRGESSSSPPIQDVPEASKAPVPT